MQMLEVLKRHLLRIVDDIDSGNCNLSEEELEQTITLLQQFNTRTQYLNRTQAAEHLHLSQRTFDRYVHDGIIPPGQHRRGDKQLFWSAADLDQVKL